jgi:hypothetical protein
MALPDEIEVFKGSKDGSIMKAVVQGKANLAANDVAIRLTHSGVSEKRVEKSHMEN